MTKVNELKSLTGAEFGDKYLDMQQEAHEDALAMFENYAQNGDNPELKALATKGAPVIKGHLERARTLDDNDANDGAAAKK